MSPEMLGPNFKFPEIKKEHFDAIHQPLQKMVDRDGDNFIETHLELVMKTLDPYLYTCTMTEVITPHHSEEADWNYRSGVALMHLHLTGLLLYGYHFKPVSEGTARTFFTELTQILKGFSEKIHGKTIKNWADKEDVKEHINAITESMKESDHVKFGEDEILKENPALKDFFESLPEWGKAGAAQVYSLMRRQYLSDQLENFFGDKPKP